ncbi:MAG TPA: hypothetical protein VHN99_06825 [Deinococcales bacterium]|nr:hypothetical protein [Deinococcales bacterium]
MPKITAQSLLFPNGPLNQAMFRGAASAQEITDALTGFTIQAGLKAQAAFPDYDTATGARLETIKGAETAYALHRAYLTVAGMIAGLPQSASAGGASASWGSDLKTLRDLADRHLADFTALAAGTPIPSDRPSTPGTSFAVLATEF